jgi:hypothetical protein
MSEQMIVSRDHHDSVVVLVSIEKLGAVRKKRGRRHAVVLQNYCLFDEFEGPCDAGGDAQAATHVRL